MKWRRVVGIAVLIAVSLALAFLARRMFAVPLEIPTGHDADEARTICDYVKMSGTVPPHGTVASRGAVGYRPLLVYGVEDPGEQEAVLVAARDAREWYSSYPVRVVFHRARVVRDSHGGARFPGGTRVIRTATIE